MTIRYVKCFERRRSYKNARYDDIRNICKALCTLKSCKNGIIVILQSDTKLVEPQQMDFHVIISKNSLFEWLEYVPKMSNASFTLD